MGEIKRIQSTDYFIGVEQDTTGDIFKAFILDFHDAWSVELTGEEIVNISKNVNPLIEAEKETFISQTIALFDVSRADVQWDIMPENDQLKVKLVSAFAGMPFQFAVTLQLVDKKTHYQFTVLPLLLIIKNLLHQRNFLVSCIRKKDLEISEYKLDGAVLSRKTVETPAFDENILNHLFDDTLKSVSLKNPGDLFDVSISSYYNQIMSKLKENTVSENSNVKCNRVEELKIKTEIKSDVPNPVTVIPEEVPTRRIKPAPPSRNKPPVKKLKNL